MNDIKDKKMTVYQKLVEVRKTVPSITRDSENIHHKFTYVSSSGLLGAIRDKMDELGLILLPTAQKEAEVTQVGDPSKPRFLVSIWLTYTWIDMDDPTDPNRIECSWPAIGIDALPEYAFGKAMTYSEKYYLFKSLQIPTDDEDPDQGEKKKGLDQPGRKFDYLKEMGIAKKKIEEQEYYTMIKIFKGEKANQVPEALRQKCYSAMIEIVQRNERFVKAVNQWKRDLKKLMGDDKIFDEILKAHECDDPKKFLNVEKQKALYYDLELTYKQKHEEIYPEGKK